MVPSPTLRGRMTRAIRRTLREAERIWECDLSHTRIEYNLKASWVAEAVHAPDAVEMIIRVNPTALAKRPELMIREIPAHEVAHLVAFCVQGEDEDWDHGPLWRAACRALGGNGDIYVGNERSFGKIH